MTVDVDCARVVGDLRELARLTSNDSGAQRLAWTGTWRKARAFYVGRLNELGLSPQRDEAGNLWTLIPGRRSGFVAVGSHLDSVSNGGWLDGALGVMSGVGLARAVCSEQPEQGLALIDFADEEGARFGRSLFGSSAVSGSLEPEQLKKLIDKNGQRLPEVLTENGVDLWEAPKAKQHLKGVLAYLELHIEQGPVLEEKGVDLGLVEGVMGIRRLRIGLLGQSGHAGATPMWLRRDPLVAFARFFEHIERFVSDAQGLATVGTLEVEPGVATVIPHSVSAIVDLRHRDELRLEELVREVQRKLGQVAEEIGCEWRIAPLWEMPVTTFDPGLVEAGVVAASAVGTVERLLSGPGHDAVEMARRVPTAMMFTPSTRGLSHVAEEDTPGALLEKAIRAFSSWVAGLLNSTAAGPNLAA